ncbi:hypothetical protein D3C87_957950 [compost metagenome]
MLRWRFAVRDVYRLPSALVDVADWLVHSAFNHRLPIVQFFLPQGEGYMTTGWGTLFIDGVDVVDDLLLVLRVRKPYQLVPLILSINEAMSRDTVLLNDPAVCF